MNSVKQIIENEVMVWLSTCDYPLTKKFVYSINDELVNVHEKLFEFVSDLPRMDNYKELLKENSYDSINEYVCLEGPFIVEDTNDFFRILRKALIRKIYQELECDFDAIICACYLRLLSLKFDELVHKYPQINDGVVIKAISDDVKEYHFEDVTLEKLIDVIRNLVED